jgi:hypothetical protein
MENNFNKKAENANKGFNYSITPEQLDDYAKWTIEEKLNWIFETNELIGSIQTPDERHNALITKHKIAF